MHALPASWWLDAMEATCRPLTAGDVRALKPNESLDVMSLHRNVLDLAADGAWNPEGTPLPAERFFRLARARFTRAPDGSDGSTDGIRGTLSWPREAPAADDAEIDLHVLDRRAGWWGPSPNPPDDAPVGWRGPMYLWSDAVEFGRRAHVYW